MLMYVFAVCDFLCRFIPVRRWRLYMRRVKLFDWYRKYNALKRSFPNLDFYDVKMIKEEWSIGFIVEGKFVFKVGKTLDTKVPTNELIREKRITDALGSVTPVRISCIRVIQAGEYLFYRYPFIPGKNLNAFPIDKITENREKLAQQIAKFIYKTHNAKPIEINDLKAGDGDGWNHNALCNGVIIDPETMEISGIVGWEHAGWGTLETEFTNAVALSDILRESGLGAAIRDEYAHILERVAAKQQKQEERMKARAAAAAAAAEAEAQQAQAEAQETSEEAPQEVQQEAQEVPEDQQA